MDFNPNREATRQCGKALGQYIGYLSRDSSVMSLNFDDWRKVLTDVKKEIRNLLEVCQSYNKTYYKHIRNY